MDALPVRVRITAEELARKFGADQGYCKDIGLFYFYAPNGDPLIKFTVIDESPASQAELDWLNKLFNS